MNPRELSSTLLVAAAFGAAALAPTPARSQAPLDLDFSFGGTGMVHLGLGFAHDHGTDVALQPDGKIVIAGDVQNGERYEVVVARYNADGSPDPTFDGDGHVITAATPSNDPGALARDGGVAVALQPDGKILVVGTSNAGPAGGNDILVLRYLTNGALDVNFGKNGVVITDVAGQSDEGAAIALQPDGMIVVAGRATVANDGKFVLVRYDENGTPDLDFGGNGTGIATYGNELYDAAYGAALQSDGKVVVTGFSANAVTGEKVSVLRVHPNGATDSSFDGDGWVYTETSASFEGGYAVTLQPDPGFPERIVVTGASGGQMIVLRYLTGGAPDTSFDGDGRAFVANSPIGGRDVAIVMGGELPTHVVVCGSISVAGVPRFGVARFLLNGTPDAAFDSDGVATTAIGTSDGSSALALAPGGKLVVSGSSGLSVDVNLTVVRYDNAGALDTGFDGDGVRVDALGNSVATARALAHQPDGKIVLAGNVSEALSSRQRIGVMRLLTNGLKDLTFDGDGGLTVDVYPGDDVVGGVGVMADGRIVVVGTAMSATGSSSDLVILRFLANGQPDPSFAVTGMLLMTLQTLDRAQAVALMPDGRIVVAGWTSIPSDPNTFVLRLLSNGTLDPTFSGDGITTVNFSSVDDRAHALALQPDGKVVIAGEKWVGDLSTGHIEAFAARFTDTGNLEWTADPTIGFQGDGAGSVAIQPDGRIVVGGWRSIVPATETQAAIVRLDASGNVDPSFGGGDGVVFHSFGNTNSRINGVGIASDGTIVVAGPATVTGSRPDFAAGGLESDGDLDPGYGANGTSLYDIVLNSNDGCAALSIDALGRIVLAGSASGLYGVVRLQGMQAFVDAPVAAVPARTSVRVAGAHPFVGSARIAFELAHGGEARLDVFDVTGAHVSTLASGARSAGPHAIEWDGRDANGAAVPPGVYFIRLAAETERATAKAIKIR